MTTMMRELDINEILEVSGAGLGDGLSGPKPTTHNPLGQPTVGNSPYYGGAESKNEDDKDYVSVTPGSGDVNVSCCPPSITWDVGTVEVKVIEAAGDVWPVLGSDGVPFAAYGW